MSAYRRDESVAILVCVQARNVELLSQAHHFENKALCHHFENNILSDIVAYLVLRKEGKEQDSGAQIPAYLLKANIEPDCHMHSFWRCFPFFLTSSRFYSNP